jgi:hydrogenase expression/formation protein HypE
MGKFDSKKLSEIIKYLKHSNDVIVPPTPGCDAGVYKVDNSRYMVISSDPCTGVPREWFGWLMIHYPSSDVATFGTKPTMAAINLLGPIGTNYKVYERIMHQVSKAAKELKIDIIAGHTGNYSSLSQVIGICTVAGFVKKERLVKPTNSKPGDLILIVKPLGLETLTNFTLANYEKSRILFGSKKAQSLRAMVHRQTCVDEALLLAKYEGLHSMHDIAEGGLITALNEMADLSYLGFDIFYESLPMMEGMKKLQEYFGLGGVETLSASSTGCLIASISPDNKEEIIEALDKKELTNEIIGKFSKKKDRSINMKNRKIRFPQKAKDPYFKIIYS